MWTTRQRILGGRLNRGICWFSPWFVDASNYKTNKATKKKKKKTLKTCENKSRFWSVFGNKENKNSESKESGCTVLVPCDPEGSKTLSPQALVHPPEALHIASKAPCTDHHLHNLQNSNKIFKKKFRKKNKYSGS